jgi:hypothetical protein
MVVTALAPIHPTWAPATAGDGLLSVALQTGSEASTVDFWAMLGWKPISRTEASVISAPVTSAAAVVVVVVGTVVVVVVVGAAADVVVATGSWVA